MNAGGAEGYSRPPHIFDWGGGGASASPPGSYAYVPTFRISAIFFYYAAAHLRMGNWAENPFPPPPPTITGLLHFHPPPQSSALHV